MSIPDSPNPNDLSILEENRRLRHRVGELEQQLEETSRQLEFISNPSLQLLTHLIDNAPVGVGFFDTDFRYVAVNRYLAGMNGIPAERHVGRTVEEVAPFVAEQAQAAFQHVMQTGRPLLDQEFSGESANRPGEVGYWSLNWFPVDGIAEPLRGAGVVLSEITDRKRMEVALRESQAALQESNRTAMRQLSEIEALYATVPVAMVLVDAGFRVVRANERMAQMHGVDAAEILGRTVAELVPDLWAQLEPIYQEVIETRRPVHNVEVHGRMKERPGVDRWWSASYAPVSDSDGTFIGVSGFIIEITDSRRVQEELQQGAQRIQRQLSEIEAIYASAPIGLCVLDSELRWTRVNHRLAEINGVPAEAHLGKTPAEVAPDFGAQCEVALRKVMESGEALLDFEMSGRDPENPERVRYWNNRWVPLKDEQGRVVGVSVALEEVTERRKAEELLRESERLYRAIGESIDYGVWVSTPDGRCTYVSESMLRMLGITQEECANFGWAQALEPGDREQTVAAWKECVRAAGRWEVEHRLRGADGEFRTVLARGVPVRDAQGEIACWAGINLDITLLKRAEERLRDRQKLESLGVLAGGLAHDFNNLLIGVIGNASLAQDMLPAGHPVASLMKRVIEAGQDAAHLTRQMLAYAGKGRVLAETLRLSDLVAETLGLVRPSIAKQIELELRLEPALPTIEGDTGQLQQAFLNLMLNAAEAIGDAAGIISVRTGVKQIGEGASRRQLEIGELGPGNYVYLEVRDTGCGMDAATKAKVFDPFFSTKFTGRGLGLAAVGGIVRAHHGAIQVASAPHAGSSFTILFPAAGDHRT